MSDFTRRFAQKEAELRSIYLGQYRTNAPIRIIQ